MNKKIFFLLTTIFIFSSNLVSCNILNKVEPNIEDTTKKIEDPIKNETERVGEEVEELGKNGVDLVNKLTDTSMNYSKENFEADMNKKGFKLEKAEDSKSYFSVANDDYILNGEKISVYEYDKNDKDKLEGDLRTVSDNGSTINGSEVKWTSGPHIYKKGRIVVLYDGNSSTVLAALTEILGIPLLG